MPLDRTFVCLVALGVGASSLCGCGPKFNVTPVGGIVRLNGKPLAGVEVRFAPEMPADAYTFPFSQATADDSGRYELRCDNAQLGAVVGTHKVIIRRPSSRPAPGAAPASSGPPIPLIYQSFADSPLQIEVKVDQKEYDIDLTSKGK